MQREASAPIALVRTLATTLFSGEDESLSAYLAAEQCRVTNLDMATISSCVTLSAMLRQLLLHKDLDRDALLEFESCLTPPPQVSLGSDELLSRTIYLVKDAGCFEDAVDSSASSPINTMLTSLAGMVAGARHGVDGIPSRWLNRLPWKENLDGIALSLWRLGIDRSRRASETSPHHPI